MPGSQNKTEKPTPKRRRELREKGQVARSREIPSVAIIILGATALYFSASSLYQQSYTLLHLLLGDSNMFVDTGQLNHRLFIKVITISFSMIAPVACAVFFAAIFSNYVQVRGIFSVQPLKPDFSKINPLNGFKQLFSLRSFAELVKSLAKLCIVTYIAYKVVKNEQDHLLPLFETDLRTILIYICRVSFKIFYKTASVMLVLAVLDFFYQRWQFEKDQMMTKEEVKEEYKQIEGNPLIKARIRAIQKSTARKRMMAAVPEADVIITNPTRIAVALKYDKNEMEAPQVVAKGMRRIAEKIREIGKAHGIPIVEDKPLAQILFKEVDVNATIPVTLYQAVAKILAYVYRLNNKSF